MKDVILKDWNWVRVARLVFALYLIYKAFIGNETIYYLLGGFLLYQAIFNIKCMTGACNNGSCEVPKEKSNGTE